jgi:hypothetical protein
MMKFVLVAKLLVDAACWVVFSFHRSQYPMAIMFCGFMISDIGALAQVNR